MAFAPTEYTINKVKIQFPCKAYPSQLTMMDKIIKCIAKKQNSLLESPTGSGKSLALLCASLAWLTTEKERIAQYQEELWEKTMRSELDSMVSSSSSDCSPIKGRMVDGLPSEVLELLTPEKSTLVSPRKLEHFPANNGGIMPSEKTNSLSSENVADTSSLPSENTVGLPAVVPDSVKDPLAEDCSVSKEDKILTNDSKLSHEDIGTEVKEQQGMDDIVEINSSEDSDFQTPKKRFRTPGMQSAPKAKKRKSDECLDNFVDLTEDDGASRNGSEWTMKLTKSEKEECSTNDKREILINSCDEKKTDIDVEGKKLHGKEEDNEFCPKIFFGTRTHKQITQIIRELNKTCYRTTKMCILASRAHTCIHPEISQSKNKNDDCRKAVEKQSCSFHAGRSVVKNQQDLEDWGFKKAWDIEELVSFGRDVKACPYYMTRDVLKDADIVFCPYNYLIDPIIRGQMEIDLYEQVVILDEAHNIEDSSRDAASWSVTTKDLEDAMNDIDYFLTFNQYPEQYRALHSVCANLRRWILERSEQLVDCDYEKSCKVWEGDQLLNALGGLGFNPETLRILVKHVKKIAKPKEQTNRKEIERTMKPATWALFEGLFMVLSFLFRNNYKFLPDYRVGIIKKSEMVPATLPGGWRRKGAWEKKWVHTLNFWCLSPAVAFSEIGLESRCVILTSGTLSPMSSFSSELGVTFPIQLEANHVVGRSQVWVSSLSVGPTGSTLNATYKFAETYSFQDEVGEAIHNVCQVVPYGVLCFLPSYSMLDKLTKRWKTTGLWERLLRLKRTFSEPRGGDKADFNDIMDEFYEAIKAAELADGKAGISGALFLAVCRGKVSEGLDFADNNARAVITVGIPFPNVKDTQVELKRKYNDQHRSERGLLNGSEWYEIQAFRALNQALGRCIRHKNDWGAILLIDERFGRSPKYRNGLSKWIRNKVVHHNNFQNVLSSLKQFSQARLENPSPAGPPGGTPCRTPGKLMDPDRTTLDLESQMRGDHQLTPSFDKTPRKSLYTPTLHEPSFTHTSPKTSVYFQPSTPKVPTDPAMAEIPPISIDPHLPKTPLNIPSHTDVKQNTPKRSTAPVIARVTPIPVNPLRAKMSPSVLSYPNVHVNLPLTSAVGGVPVVDRNPAPKILYLAPINNIQSPIPGHGNVPRPDTTVAPNRPVYHLVSPNVVITPTNVRQVNVTGQHIELVTQSVPSGLEGTPARHPEVSNSVLQMGNTAGIQNQRLILLSQGNLVNVLGDGRKEDAKGSSGTWASRRDEAGPVRTPEGQGLQVWNTSGKPNEKVIPASHGRLVFAMDDVNKEETKGSSVAGVSHGDRIGPGETPKAQGGQRLQRRPMFCSQDATEKDEDLEKTGAVSGGQKLEKKSLGVASDDSGINNEVGGEPRILGDVDEKLPLCADVKDYLETEVASPQSPLLFVTPPCSIVNSDDIMGRNQQGNENTGDVEGHSETNGVNVGKMKKETPGTRQEKSSTIEEPPYFNGELGDKLTKEKSCDATTAVPPVKKTDRSGILKRTKDLLDIVDCGGEQDVSNEATWDITCLSCGSSFVSGKQGSSGGIKAEESDIPTDSFLGNILGSLFCLNSNKKKRNEVIKTIAISDFTNVRGICSALKCSQEKQIKQEIKLNSVFVEEESTCYVPLVCSQCEGSRKPRSRVNVIAARTVTCANEVQKNSSRVWFVREKVETTKSF